MKNQQELINFLSVVLGITFSLSGLMIWYFTNEIQRLIHFSETFKKGWEDCANNCNNAIEEIVSREKKILELINLNNILRLQNKKYSKICRRLYDDNNELISLYKLQRNKMEELESKKLKKTDRKKL